MAGVNMSLVTKVVNVIIGLLILTGGIFCIISVSVQSIVIGLYSIFFGVVIVLIEVGASFGAAITKSQALSFLQSNMGRAFFYIFWAFLFLNPYWFTFLTFVSIVLFVAAIVYIVLFFMGSKGAGGGGGKQPKTTPSTAAV